ncbi:MAG: RCC1 domain-containing protein [Sandaracinaceae bacterium]
MRAALVSSLSLLAVLSGCRTAPRVEWEITFASSDLERAARWVGAEVRRESCEGEIVFATSSDDTSTESPPDLGSGRYAFVAYAHDASCVRIAEACEVRDVPLAAPEPIQLVLTAVTAPPACAATSCANGRCEASDASVADAGPDAGDVCDCPCAGDTCDGSACVPSRPATRLSIGVDVGCVIADGVICWGDGASAAALVASTERLVELAVGSNHICALRDDDALVCWGANSAGQAGLGSPNQIDVPTQVGSATDWSAISAGDFWTCGIRAGGQLYCWGANGDGQLGLGNTSAQHTPARVGTDGDWTAVSAGSGFTCGLRGTTAYCFGAGGEGRLGSAAASATTPVRVDGSHMFDRIAVHSSHAIALEADGSAWSWGSNATGQLGLGNIGGSRAMPVSIGRAFDAVRGGNSFHTCALDGTTRCCWGQNRDYELGLGDTMNRGTVTCADADEVAWTALASSLYYGCGLDTHGAVYCWGRNDARQAEPDGDPMAPPRRPVRVCLPAD